MRRLIPSWSGAELKILLTCRVLRGFADGLVSLAFPVYLAALGLSATQIGALLTTSLLGTAFFTLLAGLFAYRFSTRGLLITAALVMGVTGAAFVAFQDFWPLILVAFLGTLNPSAGDFSKFLPMEHAQLARIGGDSDRTTVFALYSLLGVLSAAFGALATGSVDFLAELFGTSALLILQGVFLLYGLLGIVTFLLYRRLPERIAGTSVTESEPLGRSRKAVFTLATLFGLDAFAGGLVIRSLLALWLLERYGLSLAITALVFFWSGVLTAFSHLAAPYLARRFGLVKTMVFSHLPSNVCLILLPFMPSALPAIVLLLIRSLLVQIDVPSRNSFLMSVVSPGERAAAAGVAALPRSLAGSASPMLGGVLFAVSPFGWPFIVAGCLKIAYDLLLLFYASRLSPTKTA